MVIARVDIVNAVAKLEGLPYEQAQRALDGAWMTVSKLGSLGLVAAAVAFAETVLPVLEGRL